MFIKYVRTYLLRERLKLRMTCSQTTHNSSFIQFYRLFTPNCSLKMEWKIHVVVPSSGPDVELHAEGASQYWLAFVPVSLAASCLLTFAYIFSTTSLSWTLEKHVNTTQLLFFLILKCLLIYRYVFISLLYALLLR